MWPFINKQPQKKGVKQLSYNNSFTETIINQTCLQKDETLFFSPILWNKNLRKILNFQDPKQNRLLKSKYIGKYQGNGAMQD